MKSVTKNTSGGFTLVEVLIVVAILGILAAVIVPEYRNYTQQAKESAAKESLQILRTAIERYAIEHDGVPPGYPNDDLSYDPTYPTFVLTMARKSYLSALPENPFNNKLDLLMIKDDELFPSDATGEHGWVYQPYTKTVKLDWVSTDSEGFKYYDY